MNLQDASKKTEELRVTRAKSPKARVESEATFTYKGPSLFVTVFLNGMWQQASGFVTNAVVAVLLTFIGDRLSLDLYLVALINFGFRIFNNVALIRRHFI